MESQHYPWRACGMKHPEVAPYLRKAGADIHAEIPPCNFARNLIIAVLREEIEILQTVCDCGSRYVLHRRPRAFDFDAGSDCGTPPASQSRRRRDFSWHNAGTSRGRLP